MDNEAIKRLVAAAGFLFRGSIEHHPKGEAPAIPEAGDIVAVRIEHVLRSTPVLRGLAGQEAFVVTRHASELRQSRRPILSTEVVSLGQQILLREIGHVETSDETSDQMAEAIREQDERPLRERVAAAALIVVGEVVDSRILERPVPPPSEHYPDWGTARVAVSAVLKGHKPRGDVEVLFAASLDRMWFHSPKLHRDVRGILLLFRIDENERPPREIPRNGWQALDPLDLQPLDRREEIERLIGGGSGGR
jgi:hypothetical protein